MDYERHDSDTLPFEARERRMSNDDLRAALAKERARSRALEARAAAYEDALRRSYTFSAQLRTPDAH